MKPEFIPVVLIWLHFFADFVLQTDEQAKNKSKSNKWLARHVLVYTACLMPLGFLFAIVNGVAHFITDWASSRLGAYYWNKKERKLFFIVLGADQAIHMTCLFLTYGVL